jgi:hypothetical protein
MPEIRTSPINGSVAWYGADLATRNDWRYALTDDDIEELQTALNGVQGRSWRDITHTDFPLPRLAGRLKEIAKTIDTGMGVFLLSGIPVERMSGDEAALALWGLGQHVGVPQPQDAGQELLHHVRDTGGKFEKDPNIRIYQTNAEQVFHNDGGDLVMLLCRRKARSGGASRMASAVTIFNEVLKRDPELAVVLQQPFHFDARGQQLPGRPRTQEVPIFVWHGERLNALHKRHYIESAQRFDEVPRLTEKQIAALDLMDELFNDPEITLSFEMAPGDIQIAGNFSIFHARDSFEDYDDQEQKRHMLRLWLGLEDGRELAPVYRETREFGPLFDIQGRATG